MTVRRAKYSTGKDFQFKHPEFEVMSMDTPITSSHPALMILSRSCILTIVEIITDCIINSCFSKKKIKSNIHRPSAIYFQEFDSYLYFTRYHYVNEL